MSDAPKHEGLVERLERHARAADYSSSSIICFEAASTLRQQAARIADLEVALRKIENEDYTADDLKARHNAPTMIWQSVASRALTEKDTSDAG